jgi:GT2 family glycosyltransferase
LTSLLAVFGQQPRAGICGPRILNPDGSYQPSWGDLPTPLGEFFFQSFLFKVWPYRYPYSRRVHPWLTADYESQQSVGWVSGAALMLRREVYDAIGGLPEDTFMYGEDVRFCALARRAGFAVIFAPGAQVYHRMQASSRLDYTRWIENYTVAVLTYHQRFGSPADLRQVARWIILGSGLRRLVWNAMLWARPARRAEARARLQGYARAAALAQQALRLGR